MREGRFELGEKKRALIEALLAEEGVERTEERIPRRSANGPAPLSFAQQRLWFLNQYEPGSYTYNVPAALRLRGPLNRAALECSLNEIIRRHEALRTTFAAVDERPVQIIHAVNQIEIPLIDLRALSPRDRIRQVNKGATEEARRVFDLSVGPLLVIRLLRVEDYEHVVLVTMHHIVSDGWSMKVFIRELDALYDAYCSGTESPLPKPPIQYADFASWQHDRMQEGGFDRQLNYWKNQLEDRPGILELPIERPRPAFKTYSGATVPMAFPKDLSESLSEISREEGATLFMTLLAAFNVFLYRYSGQEDILLGTPIANRNRAETENLIGFFVNTLVMRTDLSGDPSFHELLKRVKRAALEAYTHQDLPFEQLVKEVQSERSLSHSPLFEVLFHLQNVVTETVRLSGVTLSQIEIDDNVAKFDLSLTIGETGEGLTGKLNYNVDLFERRTVERMIVHLLTLLHGIVANPDQRVSQLPLLTEEERRVLVYEWNATGAEYPRQQTIHKLFEQQAERVPAAIALVMGDEQLSYDELNWRANQMARHLRCLGMTHESRVGICVEPSMEMILGLLGILKAGAGYVPIEPQYPKERIAFMIGDSGLRLVLTQARLTERLPEHGTEVMCLDADWESINQHPSGNAEDTSSPDGVAYVMYTSGSTGLPKGVEVLHRGVTRLLFGIDYVSLNVDQVLLQVAPLGFDASTFEIWGGLLHGARCVLAEDRLPTADELMQTIRTNQVTTLWLTASLYNSVVDEEIRALEGVSQLVIGGEALSVQHVRKGQRELANTRIVNGYGPTENTTFTCCYQADRTNEYPVGIPIGRPIGNTRVYVLDRDMNPVPVKVAGELYVAGDGLARGYLKRPELTAEKFLPNPYGEQPGERMYRTGDIARYRLDGNIEFVGRVDKQVKLRGYRIELGEIEAVLMQNPVVRESVVVMREDSLGDKRLVAYVTARPRLQPTPLALRNYLMERMPDFMVPAAFVVMENLPLTARGKVDRNALPEPRREAPADRDSFAPPRTPIEEVLADMFSEVLGIRPIGVRDNFFEIGGHSLAATQLVSRIGRTFHVKLPLRKFFEAPTVAAMAQLVSTSGDRPGQADRIATLLKKVASLSSDEVNEMLKQTGEQQENRLELSR